MNAFPTNKNQYAHAIKRMLPEKVTKKPSIPSIGTKGYPSAVPPAIRRFRRRSSQALPRPWWITASPVRPYFGSGGGSWEKARHCTQADFTIPLSLISAKPMQGSPIAAFRISTTYYHSWRKYASIILREEKSRDRNVEHSPNHSKFFRKLYETYKKRTSFLCTFFGKRLDIWNPEIV